MIPLLFCCRFCNRITPPPKTLPDTSQVISFFPTSFHAIDQLHGVPGASLVVYQRAVFCQAKGMLLAQFRTVERREAANNDAKEGRETADVFFAFAHDALADLLGAGRVDIALI